MKTLARRIVAVIITLSFITLIVPVSIVSAATAPMSCCNGRSGHCDSGLRAPKPAPKPEPMCGLKNVPVNDDTITVVAEDSDNVPSQPAVTHGSVGRPCHTDCCASVTSSKQSKRERGSVRSSNSHSVPASLTVRHDTVRAFHESKHKIEHTVPRGPPTFC
jgi:hypothetical protein